MVLYRLHLLGKRVTLFFFFLLKFGSFFSIPALTFLDFEIDSSTKRLSIYKFSDKWKYRMLLPEMKIETNLLLSINLSQQDSSLSMLV